MKDVYFHHQINVIFLSIYLDFTPPPPTLFEIFCLTFEKKLKADISRNHHPAELKTGFSVNAAACPGFHLAPALGMDFGRFSMFMRYGLNLYPVNVDLDITLPDSDIEINVDGNLKLHTLSLGFAVNF